MVVQWEEQVSCLEHQRGVKPAKDKPEQGCQLIQQAANCREMRGPVSV